VGLKVLQHEGLTLDYITK